MASRQWWAAPSSNNEKELHEWAMRMWRRMDRDNNGSLTRQELDCEEFYTILRATLLPSDKILQTGGPTYARAEMDMDQALNFALRKADLNQDGRLSFEEFKAFILVLRQPQMAAHTANLIFALFDVNRDNSVDEHEFRQIFRFYLGHNPTEEEFQEEWGRLNCSDAGQVSRDEYVKWLQTSGNPVFREHSPPAYSKVHSGATDWHATKRESPTTPSVATPSAAGRTASSSFGVPQAAWRPWHSYSNMAWAQVSQSNLALDTSDSWRTQGKRSQSAPKQNLHLEKFQSSTASFFYDRPRWNQRLSTSNPNLPNKHGKATLPKHCRAYLSRPQSSVELAEHYSSNPGFEKHLRSLQQPEKSYNRQSKCSSDRLEVRLSPELLDLRSKSNYGKMKNPATGKRQQWVDNWVPPPLIKYKYVSGSNSLRTMGAPPRYMYTDEYDDPEFAAELRESSSSIHA